MYLIDPNTIADEASLKVPLLPCDSVCLFFVVVVVCLFFFGKVNPLFESLFR